MTEELDEMLDGLSDEQLALLEKSLELDEEGDEQPQRGFQLRLKQKKGETQEQSLGRQLLQPEIKAAIATQTILSNEGFAENLDINALVDELNHQTSLIRQKDLSRAEGMLTAQAHVLDQLFIKLVNAGVLNMQYPDSAATYLKLAMKSQAQCRSTWEGISKIQNPPVTNHVQQQNIANAQQINNAPNQLAEETHELLPDRSNESSASPFDPPVETVGEVHRAKDSTGEK